MSVLSQFSLEGRVAVVTGGNRNLGLAAAQALAEAGADLALLARDARRLETAVERIDLTGRRVCGYPVDQANADEVDAAFERIVGDLGTPDVLVNMAGIEHQAMLAETEPDDWKRVFDVNLGGLFACCRAFVRTVGDRGGAIVNVASIAGTVGFPGQAAYSASKGGVASVTRAFAIELARRGIRVNAIAPGYFEVGMPAKLVADPEARERLLRRVPQRRLGRPDEIGPLVVYLASDASSFMTGSTIHLDGGYTAQ